MTNLSKVTVSFLFVPRKKDGREGALDLRPLRGGQDDCLPSSCASMMVLECFSLYFDHSSPLYPPAEQISV